MKEMKTVKVKQKKNAEKKDYAGRFVGLVFLLILIAVCYYMYDMFRSRVITSESIAGDWHHTAEMNEKSTEHWVFNTDGTAMKYVLDNDTKIRSQEVTYTYTIRIAEDTYQKYIDNGILKKAARGGYEDSNGVIYSTLDEGKTQAELVVTTSNVRKSDEETYAIRVTLLSKAEMDIIYIYDRFTTDTTRLTKNLF